MATLEICYTDANGVRRCTTVNPAAARVAQDSTARTAAERKQRKRDVFFDIVEELAKVVRKDGKDGMAEEPEEVTILYRA